VVSVVTTSAGPVTQEQADLAGHMPTQEVLAELYDTASPSVVNIQVTTDPQLTTDSVPNPLAPFGLPFGQPQEQTPTMAEGSGFVYDTQGHIVTNNHVVDGASTITVYFANGSWADGEVVAADAQADLAVLKVTPPQGVELQPLPMAPAGNLRVGYYAVALGSPFGLDETMTVGVISALGRSFPTGDATAGGPTYSLPDVIQTDTAINPGNSGGPLLDLKGEVVGVNFAINSPVRANSGVGFAIPISVVQKVVPALIKDGAYAYSYLGISGQTINAILAGEENINEGTQGVYVGVVPDGGPAAKAGVQAADVITGIDKQPVSRFEDVLSYLFNNTKPGQTATLHILRNDKSVDIDVKLAERPSGQTEASGGQRETGLSINEAIQIAKHSVADAELINQVDSASATQAVQDDGTPVWIVKLGGNDKTATVTVDAQTGEVLSLDVQ
jgi:2-alkenal reductase